MRKLTEKNYKNLPEVRKKRDEEQMKEQKKKELMNRGLAKNDYCKAKMNL